MSHKTGGTIATPLTFDTPAIGLISSAKGTLISGAFTLWFSRWSKSRKVPVNEFVFVPSRGRVKIFIDFGLEVSLKQPPYLKYLSNQRVSFDIRCIAYVGTCDPLLGWQLFALIPMFSYYVDPSIQNISKICRRSDVHIEREKHCKCLGRPFADVEHGGGDSTGTRSFLIQFTFTTALAYSRFHDFTWLSWLAINSTSSIK